jgi:hypothetical protein
VCGKQQQTDSRGESAMIAKQAIQRDGIATTSTSMSGTKVSGGLPREFPRQLRQVGGPQQAEEDHRGRGPQEELLVPASKKSQSALVIKVDPTLKPIGKCWNRNESTTASPITGLGQKQRRIHTRITANTIQGKATSRGSGDD